MTWYRAGTISLTQGSDIVVGTGTNWIDQQRGWTLTTEQGGPLYEVRQIISSTEMRLARPVATDGADLEYFIIPTNGLSVELYAQLTSAIQQFRISRENWAAVLGDFALTSYQLWLDRGNTGTPEEFLEAIRGPLGPVGPVGPVGPLGPSAYQVWLDAGNTGTVQDFLNDLSQGAVALAGDHAAAADQSRTDAEAARDLAQSASATAIAAQGSVEADRVSAETARDQAEQARNQSAADMAAIEQLYDEYNDSWLGRFDEDPVTNNDGDPIQIGAGYWNTTSGHWKVYGGPDAGWEAPAKSAATSAAQALTAQDGAETAQTASEAARDAAQAAQGAGEAALSDARTARDAAQGHAVAASLASNATEWQPDMQIVRGALYWSPSNGKTYRAMIDIANSQVDPALVQDESVFVLVFAPRENQGADIGLAMAIVFGS